MTEHTKKFRFVTVHCHHFCLFPNRPNRQHDFQKFTHKSENRCHNALNTEKALNINALRVFRGCDDEQNLCHTVTTIFRKCFQSLSHLPGLFSTRSRACSTASGQPTRLYTRCCPYPGTRGRRVLRVQPGSVFMMFAIRLESISLPLIFVLSSPHSSTLISATDT